jgi:hypothetical protein
MRGVHALSFPEKVFGSPPETENLQDSIPDLLASMSVILQDGFNPFGLL